MNTSEVGRYLHVTRERARQIVNDHESFPAPVVTDPRRRWDAAEVKEWAERHWWGKLPWRGYCDAGDVGNGKADFDERLQIARRLVTLRFP